MELNKKYTYCFLLIIAISCGACTHDPNEDSIASDVSHEKLENTTTSLPLDQFITWAGDAKNDLLKKKEINDITYQLSYMPTECMAYMELKGNTYTEDKFKNTCKHYTAMSYFNFRMKLNEGSGELLKYDLQSAEQYNERINYMSFQMQHDVFLVQNKDTLYPGMFHFERIFEVAPFATVMLAFDDAKFKKDDEFTIVYNDHLFNKGYIKYNYKPKQLIDLPNISGV